MGSPYLFCGIEEVISGVGGPGFLSSVDRITAGGRGFAALGVDALDGSGLGEDSVAFVAHDFEKEPGDGVGFGRRGLVDGLASTRLPSLASQAGPAKCLPNGLLS